MNNELIYFTDINQAKEYANKFNGEIWEIIDIYFIIPKKQAISESIEYTNKILNFCRDKNINYFVYAIIYQSGYLSGFNEQQLEIQKEFLTKIIAKIIIERDLDKKTNITKKELINEFLKIEINLQNNLENNEKFFELIKFPYSDENIKIIDTIHKNIKTLLEIINLKNPEFKELPDIINDILKKQSKYLNDVKSGNFYSTNENDLEKLKKELQEERTKREHAELKVKKELLKRKKIEKFKNNGFYRTSKSLELSRFPYSDDDKEMQLNLFETQFPDFKKTNPCILGLNELSKTETHSLEIILELFSRTNYKGNLESDEITVTGLHGEEKILSPKLRISLQEFLVNCNITDTEGKNRDEFKKALNKLSNSDFFMYWRIKENNTWKIYARKDSLIKLAFIIDENDRRQIDLILELSPIALFLKENYVCKPVGWINELRQISIKEKKSTQYNFVNYLLLQAYYKNTRGKTKLTHKLDTIIKNLFLGDERNKQGLKFIINKLNKYCENIKQLGFLISYNIDEIKEECTFTIDKSKITNI